MKPTEDLVTWAAAYREARQPPADLRTRIAAAIEDEGQQASARPSDRWRTWGITLAGGGLLAAAALLLLSWVVRLMDPAVVGSHTPQSAPYQHAPGDPETAVAVDGDAASLPNTVPVAAPTPTVVEPSAAPTIDARPRNDRAPTITAAPIDAPAPPAAGIDLESLRQLRAAEKVLDSDPARARTLLDAHATTYPNSPLAPEREALWLRAACRSSKTADVERRRAAFTKRAGVAIYISAIERDCGR